MCGPIVDRLANATRRLRTEIRLSLTVAAQYGGTDLEGRHIRHWEGVARRSQGHLLDGVVPRLPQLRRGLGQVLQQRHAAWVCRASRSPTPTVMQTIELNRGCVGWNAPTGCAPFVCDTDQPVRNLGIACCSFVGTNGASVARRRVFCVFEFPRPWQLRSVAGSQP